MKSNLWVFGDSFSSHFDSNPYYYANLYIKWKGYVPKIFSQLLSKEFDLNEINKSKGGNDNYTIFENICQNINEIKENDIVIIGWSNNIRFRIIDNNNNWISIIPENLNNDFVNTHLKNISKNTLEELIMNRNSKKYLEELDNISKYIKKTLKVEKLIQWTPFNYKLTNILNINPQKTIKMETNKLLNDDHFNEEGHLDIYIIFYNLIKNKKNII